jgi:peptidoglycan/LPS O-acetylase OafA/YrhL
MAVRNTRTWMLLCGLATSLSGCAALLYVLYAPRVPILDRPPQTYAHSQEHYHYVPFSQAFSPPLAWWLLVAGLILFAAGVGLCSVLYARTEERRWRRMLTVLGALYAVDLLALASGGRSLVEDGPVVFVPTLVLVIVCLALSFLSGSTSSRHTQGAAA